MYRACGAVSSNAIRREPMVSVRVGLGEAEDGACERFAKDSVLERR